MMTTNTNKRTSMASTVLALALVLAAAPAARAVNIGDVTRVEGQRINKLHGLGLVIGLNGTGDGGDYMPAMRPLAAFLEKLGDPVISAVELKNARNIAIVAISVTIPAGGVRKGDRLDVQVASAGASKSLKGGRLILTPLQGPQRNSVIYALAEGGLRLEDPTTPTVAVIDGGAVMEEEVLTEFVENNRFRLVLNEAYTGFSTAAEIAQVINERNIYTVGRDIAKALDARTIEVQVPDFHQANPVPFLGDIQRLSLRNPPETTARVEINEHNGTIVITGNVEMSAAIVSHPSLTLSAGSATSASAASPSASATAGTTTSVGPQAGPFVKLDPQGDGGVRLQDLVNAMNVLKVPSEDQIAIIKLLAKAGRIHAEVVFAD